MSNNILMDRCERCGEFFIVDKFETVSKLCDTCISEFDKEIYTDEMEKQDLSKLDDLFKKINEQLDELQKNI